MKTPKEECEELMSSALPFAEQMLSRYREFLPFGEAMGPDGQIFAIAGDAGGEHPPSAEVIAVLEQGFREGAKQGEYKATALVVDMLVVPPGKQAKQDAVAVRLDHRDGFSAIVVFPYAIAPTGSVTFAPAYAVAGEHRIFPR